MFKEREGKLQFSLRRVFISLLKHFKITFLPKKFVFFLICKNNRAYLKSILTTEQS